MKPGKISVRELEDFLEGSRIEKNDPDFYHWSQDRSDLVGDSYRAIVSKGDATSHILARKKRRNWVGHIFPNSKEDFCLFAKCESWVVKYEGRKHRRRRAREYKLPQWRTYCLLEEIYENQPWHQKNLHEFRLSDLQELLQGRQTEKSFIRDNGSKDNGLEIYSALLPLRNGENLSLESSKYVGYDLRALKKWPYAVKSSIVSNSGREIVSDGEVAIPDPGQVFALMENEHGLMT